MPKVSIIIPVYNTEKYLRACLDSVSMQDFSDFEAILVDDGSTDKSGDICDEYASKDARFQVIHKQNGGVSSARNCGLCAMSGDYFCFSDSDDKLNKNYISTLYSVLNENNAIISVADYYNDIPRSNSGKITCYTRDDALVSLFDLLNGLSGWIAAKMFKSDIVNIYGLRFNETLTLLEDIVFHFDYISHIDSNQRVVKIDQQIYQYTNREGSALTERGTNKIYKKSWFDSIRALDIIFEKANNFNALNNIDSIKYKKLITAITVEKVRQCVSQMRIIARCGDKSLDDFKICKKYLVKHLSTYWKSPYITLKQKIGATMVIIYPKL